MNNQIPDQIQIHDLRKQVIDDKFAFEAYLQKKGFVEYDEHDEQRLKTGVVEKIVSEMLHENMIAKNKISSFSKNPTIANLVNCFAEGDLVANERSLITFTGVGNSVVGSGVSTELRDGHHPLIINTQDDVLAESAPQLAAQGSVLLQSYEKGESKTLKLDPGLITQLRAALLKNGSKELPLSEYLLQNLSLCVREYEKYLQNAFFQHDVVGLKKLIGNKRGTKTLTQGNKELLDSVFRRIEGRYNKESMMYERAANIAWSESSLLLSLYKGLGNEGHIFSDFLPIIQVFTQTRKDLLLYREQSSEVIDTFVTYIEYDKGDKEIAQLRELLFTVQKSKTNEQLSSIIGQLASFDPHSPQYTDPLIPFGPAGEEIKTIIENIHRLAICCTEQNDVFDAYIEKHRSDLMELTKKITSSGHELDRDVHAFFKTLGALLEPQTSIYFHFKQATYFHNIPFTLNQIRNMITATGRTNLPSGVMLLTGKPTTNISTTTNEEEAKAQGGDRDPNGPFVTFRGILDAYIETAERLSHEAFCEIALFKKCVGMSAKKITPEEMAYLWKYMEMVYKQYFQSLAQGTGITIQLKGISNFSLTQNIKTIPVNVLIEDFLHMCLGPKGFLERIFDSYNSTRMAKNDDRVVQKKDEMTGAVLEVVRATEWFTKLIYDHFKIYTAAYSQWTQGMLSKKELVKTIRVQTLQHQYAMMRMHMDAIEGLQNSDDETKAHDAKNTMKQILQGHVAIYALIATVSEMHQALLAQGIEEHNMPDALRKEYGKESIHAPLLLLQSLMSRIDNHTRKTVTGTFVSIVGSDNIFSLIALLYQESRNAKNEDNRRRHLFSLLDTWYERLENSALPGEQDHMPLLVEQLTLLNDMFGETVAGDIYKLLALYFIDSGTGALDLDDIAYVIQEEDEGGVSLHRTIASQHQLYTRLESSEELWEEHTFDAGEFLRGKLSAHPWETFQQYILPIAHGNVLLTEICNKLFALGESERLLETCLAYAQDDINPDYPESGEEIKYRICAFFEKSGILPQKLTMRKIARKILGSGETVVSGPGLEAGATVIAGEEDITALESLLSGTMFDLGQEVGGDKKIESIAKRDMQQEDPFDDTETEEEKLRNDEEDDSEGVEEGDDD